MGARRWMMQYGVALALAFLFAMILGQVSLFRESSLGKLRASDLVQFVGYSGSVVIGWLGTLLGVVLGLTLAFNVETIVPALEQVLGMHIFDPDVFYITRESLRERRTGAGHPR